MEAEKSDTKTREHWPMSRTSLTKTGPGVLIKLLISEVVARTRAWAKDDLDSWWFSHELKSKANVTLKTNAKESAVRWFRFVFTS